MSALRVPLEPRHCQLLGLVGSLVLASGGASAGALPIREALALRADRAATGLVGVYFGLVLLIAAWMLLGRTVRGAEPPSRRTLLATFGLWAAPLLVAPPLFSRDVYSYLAQGAMVDAHMDVYVHGPAHLGGPLPDEIPAVWQHTPTPYGPVFLAFASAVTDPSRPDGAFGIAGLRLVALLGVGLMVLCLPRLARHCGADERAALWLGVLNPLVLLHLVAGAHNDAVMLGLLGAGLVVAVGVSGGARGVGDGGVARGGEWGGVARGLGGSGVARVVGGVARVLGSVARGLGGVARTFGSSARVLGVNGEARKGGSRVPGTTTERATPTYALLGTATYPLVGAVLITLAALVKAPAALGLVAVAVLWCRRLDGRGQRVLATALTAATAGATTVVTTALTGTGYGWIAALRTPASPENWSLTNLLGRLTGHLLSGTGLAGYALPLWHTLGMLGTGTVVLLVWRRRHTLGTVHSLGLCLLAVAVLGPAIRPWYVLWGLFLIAAAAPQGRGRGVLTIASGVLALATLPSGFAADARQLALATLGGVLAVAVLTCTHLAARSWRSPSGPDDDRGNGNGNGRNRTRNPFAGRTA
ncbi:polyprenol phosphomannose-dependent alpha 1,6 mannosyltransferase MptB [Streptomyces sp. NA04227]|uniref:polyprenol phosphomannose-dependent alpha 1,6 mannosyltransferase MptB n=1 Tax=Streptomyces sp. NA04227 TaxID=2742136 RepID=UPI00159193D1|nr:polyprenol phosphomannose-dependent alpha 1,6 mannosyltransferase MptB [Streptomyces sp. NA04227]QKW07375.1 polyprenol phosphomannose-dependent alpha 1,6 mannosyltransferase MptB [Streptomyces sp. NA04227]